MPVSIYHCGRGEGLKSCVHLSLLWCLKACENLSLSSEWAEGW